MNHNMIRMLAALGALGVPMAPVSDPYLYMPDPPDPRTQDAYDKASAKRARKNAARLRMVANGTLLARGR